MQIVTFKCPDKLVTQLEMESTTQELRKSELIRRALVYYLSCKSKTSKQSSLYSLSKDLCGSLEGPTDLSENPEHLEGYGQ